MKMLPLTTNMNRNFTAIICNIANLANNSGQIDSKLKSIAAATDFLRTLKKDLFGIVPASKAFREKYRTYIQSKK